MAQQINGLMVLQGGDPRGRPVFLFHGWPGSCLQRPPDMRRVRALGIRLITIDRPGIAGSMATPGRQLRDWATTVARIADSLSLGDFHVVGVSAGGPYALSCAHGLGDRVRGVALMGGLAPQPAMAAIVPWFQQARFFYSLVRRSPALIAPLLHAARWRLPRVDTVFPEFVLRRFPQSDQRALRDAAFSRMLLRDFRRAFRRGIEGPLQDAGVLAAPWRFDPSEISSPVHIWHGLEDTIVPIAMGRHLADIMPKATPHWVPGVGHYGLVNDHWEEVITGLLRA